MKIINKVFFQIILIIVFFTDLNAQDIHFSQYFSNPLVLNPALTGQFKGDVRITSSYKNQWLSLSDNCYNTYGISVDAPIYKNKVSGGLSFYNDRAGDSKMGTTGINFSLASKIDLNTKNELSVGIQPGWTQRSFDISGLTFDSQYNGTSFNSALPSNENGVNQSKSFFDISSGIYLKSTINNNLKFNTGLGVFHINRPIQGFYDNADKLHTKWSFHAESEIVFGSSRITYVPSVMILKQGPAFEANMGLSIKRGLGMNSLYTGANVSSNIVMGVFYRMRDAFILYVGCEYKKSYSIGFSYDINASNLRKASYFRGGTEISFIYKLFKSNKTIPKIN